MDSNQPQQNKLVSMNRQQLEAFTQDHRHHGVNSQEVLEKFLAYQALCSDPLLIFRYMEEKAVCTFLPAFWIAKAELYAQIGDYSNCFECIDLARSRIDEDENQLINLIQETHTKLAKKMIEEIKKYPLSSKRTVSSFNLSQEDSVNSNKEDHAVLLKLYQEKYGGLKREKQLRHNELCAKKQKSWLFAHYQKEDEKQKMIQEQIHQHSVKISKEVKYHSMHTPIRARDPQRLTKTMDSVEILKKKQSTRQKSKKNQNRPFYDDSQLEIENVDSCSRMMVSLPVGRKFASVKRRVTFKSDCPPKIEKIRNEEVPPSFGKAQPCLDHMGSEKMEEESEQPESYSQNIPKK